MIEQQVEQDELSLFREHVNTLENNNRVGCITTTSRVDIAINNMLTGNRRSESDIIYLSELTGKTPGDIHKILSKSPLLQSTKKNNQPSIPVLIS